MSAHGTRSVICECGASVLVINGRIAPHPIGGGRRSCQCKWSGRKR